VRAESTFRPAWWLPGAHIQTLFPYLFRKSAVPALRRERLELPDGDFLDIDWTLQGSGPLVLLLHGLEGSIGSHYVRGLLGSLSRHGFRVALLYFRGCSGEPNRLARSYHSGETGDLDRVIRRLVAHRPTSPLYVVGVSLGGNVILKWLGENPRQSLVARAVAVSVPFDLNAAANRLEKGFSRLYQAFLLHKLRRLKTFRQFDDRVTAPLHGFAGVDDYYRRSSSGPYLQHILTPTLILQAADDPFMTADVIPAEDQLGPGVHLEVSRYGGHVGFVAGRWPWKPQYWMDQRVCEFLRAAA
jgi:predicted alpha/beta-fold hydrolase